MQNNCANTSLSVYLPAPGEWTAQKLRHLYRRIGYGVTKTEVENGLTMSPAEVVDFLVAKAVNTLLPETPYWADWTSEDYDNGEDGLGYEHEQSIKNQWIERSFTEPLQAKMSLFWHDHFATQKEVYYCNSSLWHYYKLVHEYAFGNFRTFVEKMGINKAMLVFLDGNQNVANEPNENYARELMELFTMGEGNGYTQTDIEQVARALTGWRYQMYDCGDVYFDPSYHDNGIKTIFGQSGNFGYEDVHELIFTLRADETASYICKKLYQHFVYQEPNKEIVAQLAQTFKSSNWELVPVIKQILKSEHFYDDSLTACRIKHPIELVANFFIPMGNNLESDFREGFVDYVKYSAYETGMNLFEPPNVAGWPGHRVWLSENALTYRWSFCGTMLRYYLNESGYEKLRQLAIDLTSESNDPFVITMAMAEHFLGAELDEESKIVATLYLRSGIPDNYFDDGSWNLYWEEAPQQLANLLAYFIQLPEFQLA